LIDLITQSFSVAACTKFEIKVKHQSHDCILLHSFIELVLGSFLFCYLLIVKDVKSLSEFFPVSGRFFAIEEGAEKILS
jgi:hypothetical protein